MKLNLYIENSYRKDFKIAIKQNLLNDNIRADLNLVIETLLSNEPLDKKYKDHPLKHNLQNFRDCHIRPDLILVYKIENNTLSLVRIGRHLDVLKNKK